MIRQQEPQPQERTANLPVSSALDWTIPKPKLTPFRAILDQANALEELRLSPEKVTPASRGVSRDDPEDSVALNKFIFTEAGSVQIPGFGLLRMTQWVKRQLGTEIGVRWDKFFGEQDPDKINRAIKEHFKTRSEIPVRRIVARSHINKETATDGLLRGLVSPTYSEIRDAHFLDRVHKTAGHEAKNMGFSKVDLRDNGSHLCLIYKQPISLTGSSLPPNTFRGVVGSGHERPRKDIGFYGLRLRNSEVGNYSFTADAYIMRLVCTNGLMYLIDGERVMKRRHVGVTNDKLDEIIEEMFAAMPRLKTQIIARNRELRAKKLSDPEETIRSFLLRHQQPKVVQEAAIKAYSEEPEPTAFGVLQSLTRLGAALREAPDRQHDIELLAGQYAAVA
jgi:hypothetical protein